jgi:hypothetical protein
MQKKIKNLLLAASEILNVKEVSAEKFQFGYLTDMGFTLSCGLQDFTQFKIFRSLTIGTFVLGDATEQALENKLP